MTAILSGIMGRDGSIIIDEIEFIDPPWGPRAQSAGPAGESYIAEIITDPADQRGLDARPARLSA